MRSYGHSGGTVALGLGLLLLAWGCAADRPSPAGRDKILQRILPLAAQVIVEQEGRRVRSGSGVVIAAREDATGARCYVLTSAHTLARSSNEEVYVLLGRSRNAGTKTRATVLAQREAADLDLGLLRVSSDPCPAARIGTPPALGDAIWVVTFPWGRHLTLVSGVVSQVNDEAPADRDAGPRLMIDASVSYGASGGGVFEAETGALVGLVDSYRTARVTFKVDTHPAHVDVPVPGETFVVPLSDIRRFLTETGYADLIGKGAAIAGPKR